MPFILKAILVQPLYNLLMLLVFVMPGNSLGLAVILLTILIKVALLPTTKSLTRQQALIAKLKPEIDAIREKHKADQSVQAREMMAFYKRHHVNPAGSCLPLVIQLIILVVLYYVFRIGITSARFDLLYSITPRPAEVNPHFFGIDLSKPNLWVLPIVAGLLQFVQSYQMMAKTKTKSEDPSAMLQKQMTFAFPFLTIFAARTFPAALPLYWSVSSSIAIIQQAVILRQMAKITVQQADEILEDGTVTDQEILEAQKGAIVESTKTKKGVEVTVRKKKATK